MSDEPKIPTNPEFDMLANTDVTATLSGENQPPKQVRVIFSRKIWLTVFAFLGVTIIGSVVEFFVQTPMTKYVEKFTGPRIRTLNREVAAGNFRFVYDAVRPKFHDQPEDEDYLSLYIKSTEGVLQSQIKAKDWTAAEKFVGESLTGMPAPKEFQAKIKRTFLAAIKDDFISHRGKLSKDEDRTRLEGLAKTLEKMAATEDKDPEVQFAVGEALANFTPWENGYNLDALPYFHKFLKQLPEQKGREIISKTLESGLTLSSSSPMAPLVRELIGSFYLEEFLPKLRESFVVASFEEPSKVAEGVSALAPRQMAFAILKERGRLDLLDEFRFHLLTVLHASGSASDHLEQVKGSTEYFKKIEGEKTVAQFISDAQLPPVVPAGVLSESGSSEALVLVRPILAGSLLDVVAPYCHERLFSQHENIRTNCLALLKDGKLLTKEEQRKLAPAKRVGKRRR